jgi:hypothetical protein
MGIYRLDSGPDGESRLTPLSLPDVERAGGAMPNGPITFHVDPPGTFFDWHPAPRRQWVIILSGNWRSDWATAVGSGSVRETRAWSRTPADAATPPASLGLSRVW